ncbi:hypothetical protein LTR86_007378 [Recurvomyces mirabilis]|nr:hypothetical protein LTR86_007378 [Recurvomyces mirabilis]
MQSWDIAGSFLLVGLITTAIVSGVTPSTTPRYLDTPTYLVLDDVHCWNTSSSRPNSTDFAWKLSNGSYIGLNSTFDPVCPASSIIRQFQQLYNLPPDGWGYVVDNTPLRKNALGAPNSVGDFSYAFGAGLSGWSAAWTQFASVSACFPTLIGNPVRCQAAGNVSVQAHRVTVSSGDCDISTEIHSVDPTNQGASAAGACTAGHDLGTATILIGSVNSHAVQLATAMLDGTWLNDTKHPDHYAVTCTVDITPIIGFRNLTYARLAASNTVGASYAEASGASFGVSGSGDGCDLVDTETGSHVDRNAILTAGALSAGASASWPLLSEGSYRDGWWSTLWQATQNLGGTVFQLQNNSAVDLEAFLTFNQSTNSLEDALGLASAMGLGSYYGSFNPGSLVSVDATTVLDGTRVGPGRRWALVFIVPELYAAVLLVVLLRRQIRVERSSARGLS